MLTRLVYTSHSIQSHVSTSTFLWNLGSGGLQNEGSENNYGCWKINPGDLASRQKCPLHNFMSSLLICKMIRGKEITFTSHMCFTMFSERKIMAFHRSFHIPEADPPNSWTSPVLLCFWQFLSHLCSVLNFHFTKLRQPLYMFNKVKHGELQALGIEELGGN